MNFQLSILKRVGDCQFNFVDTPGHHEYFLNTIKAATQVDVAILVFDITKVTENLNNGFIRQLISLIKANNIRNVIIGVNKMDIVGWKKETFFNTQNQLNDYFISEKMEDVSMTYIPISAYKGDNLDDSMKIPWYQPGEYLLGQLLKIKIKENNYLCKPLQMTVTEATWVNWSKKGLSVTVKIEGGVLSEKNQDRLRILPSNLSIVVKSVSKDANQLAMADAGDTIDLLIALSNEEDVSSVGKGNVICSDIHPIPNVQK